MRCLAETFGFQRVNQVRPLPKLKKVLIETFPLTNDFHFPDFEQEFCPNKLTFEVKESGTITFNSSSIRFETESTVQSHETERLGDMMRYIHVDWSKSCLDLDADPNTLPKDCSLEDPQKMTWLALDKKGRWDKGYSLSEGDVFRIGKVSFKVRAIFSGKNVRAQSPNCTSVIGNSKSQSQSPFMGKTVDEKNVSFGDMTTQMPSTTARIESEVTLSCRICLDETSDAENPIVQMCKCSGTLKGIHVNCLRKWFAKKTLKKETGNLVSLYHKPLFCEICKTELSDSITKDKREYSLIEFPEIKGPHMILEASIGKRKNGFHIINFGNKGSSIYVGTLASCDIRIVDESIEMRHAVLSYSRGKVYVESLSKSNPVQMLIKDKSILIAEKKMRLKVSDMLLQITSTE